MTEQEARELIQNRIIFLLNSENLSMRGLSAQLGLSESYINQVLNNDMMPSLSIIIELCELCNMTLSEFFNTDNIYPVEYYQVNEEVKKLSVPRLNALYILLHDEIEDENKGNGKRRKK